MSDTTIDVPPTSPDGSIDWRWDFDTMTVSDLAAELSAIDELGCRADLSWRTSRERRGAIVAELSARAAAERARWTDEQVATAWDQVRHALFKERSLTDW